MNKTKLDLKVGDTEMLLATAIPENSVINFISNDEAIVKVTPKQGKVTAVSEGTSIITATSSNGQEAICEVTVTPTE